MMRVLSHRPDAGGAFSNADVVNADLTPRSYTMWDACGFSPRLQAMFHGGKAFAALLDTHTIQAASLAFRASYRPMMLPFSPRWPHDSWISIIVAACSAIVPVAENLMLYRQHGSNVVGAPPPQSLARLRERYNKLRNLRGYYRKKRKMVDDVLCQLDDLRERIEGENNPDGFARPLAALASQRAKLKKSRRKAANVLMLFGERSAI